MIQKALRRIFTLVISLPTIILALIFEFGKQPWLFVWDRIFASVDTQQKKTVIYLKKYFGFVPLASQSQQFMLTLGTVKLVLTKKFCEDIIQLHVILINYLDIIYPYMVTFKIPAIAGYEGIYEHGEVVVKPGDVVIDAGANVGIFSFFAAEKAGPTGKVYAFEPIPEYQEILRDSKGLNENGQTVEIVTDALGDSEHPITITYPDIEKTFTAQTQLTTVDAFVKKHSIAKVGFIKSDIEGFERHLLTGAKQTLATHKPRLSICTYHLPDDREVISKIIMDANPAYQIYYGKYKLYAW